MTIISILLSSTQGFKILLRILIWIIPLRPFFSFLELNAPTNYGILGSYFYIEKFAILIKMGMLSLRKIQVVDIVFRGAGFCHIRSPPPTTWMYYRWRIRFVGPWRSAHHASTLPPRVREAQGFVRALMCWCCFSTFSSPRKSPSRFIVIKLIKNLDSWSMTMNPSPLRVMLKLVSEYPITVLNAYHLTFAEPQHAHVLIKIANDHVFDHFWCTRQHEWSRVRKRRYTWLHLFHLFYSCLLASLFYYLYSSTLPLLSVDCIIVCFWCQKNHWKEWDPKNVVTKRPLHSP